MNSNTLRSGPPVIGTAKTCSVCSFVRENSTWSPASAKSASALTRASPVGAASAVPGKRECGDDGERGEHGLTRYPVGGYPYPFRGRTGGAEASRLHGFTGPLDPVSRVVNETKNFAARMGRWSAQHRKKAIFGWLAFVVLSFVIGGAIGVKAPEDDTTYVGDSGKAHQLVDGAFPDRERREHHRSRARAMHGAVRAAVDETVAAVSRQKDVYDVESPFAKGNEGQISKDGSPCS